MATGVAHRCAARAHEPAQNHVDGAWGEVTDVTQLPTSVLDQLVQYFSTYKRVRRPDNPVSVGSVYGRQEAEKVISAVMSDYAEKYAD